jgi:hypothetical protein
VFLNKDESHLLSLAKKAVAFLEYPVPFGVVGFPLATYTILPGVDGSFSLQTRAFSGSLDFRTPGGDVGLNYT